MDDPLRYIIVGTGGFGARWCRDFLPRLTNLGKATPAAAVDLDAGALANAREGLGLPPEKCYTDVDRAFAENGDDADFVIVVVPPGDGIDFEQADGRVGFTVPEVDGHCMVEIAFG